MARHADGVGRGRQGGRRGVGGARAVFWGGGVHRQVWKRRGVGGNFNDNGCGARRRAPGTPGAPPMPMNMYRILPNSTTSASAWVPLPGSSPSWVLFLPAGFAQVILNMLSQRLPLPSSPPDLGTCGRSATRRRELA